VHTATAADFETFKANVEYILNIDGDSAAMPEEGPSTETTMPL